MKKYFVLSICIILSVLQASAQCSVHINPPKDTVLCKGDSLLLTATGSGGGSSNDSLDQSQLGFNSGTSCRALFGYSYWQSFTAGKTGRLTQINIGVCNAISGSLLVTIWGGSGIYGTLLDSVAAPINVSGGNHMVPIYVNVPVIAGNVYTFQYRAGPGIPDPYCIQDDNPAPYSGGQMAFVDPYSGNTSYPGFDMVFQTFVEGSGSSLLNYLWSIGSSDTSTMIYGGGIYSVTVSATGCTGVDSIHIIQDSLSIATLSASTRCGSSNGSASLSITGASLPYAINWSNSLHSDTVSNLAAGIYYTSVSDAFGCMAMDSVVIDSSAKISVTASAIKTTMCSSDSLPVCATPGFASYRWNTGSGDSCTYANAAGNYYVSVTDADNCTAVSNSVAIAVYPVSSVSIIVNGDTLSSYNADSYQWYFNGNPLSGDTTFYYVATRAGDYSVQETDTNGCTVQSNEISVTGITNLRKTGVAIYPNPSTGNWQLIVSDELIGATVEISDENGRVIFKSQIRNEVSRLSPDVPAGVYLLKIISAYQIITRKLIRE